MSYYRINLTPVETYFFGGEKHDATGETINYFTVSEEWPQQSTLFGFTRYCLLHLKGLLNSGRRLNEEARALVGSTGFNLSADVLPDSTIKNISKLYFSKQDQPYIFAPKDLNYSITEKYGRLLFVRDGELIVSKGLDDNLYMMPVDYFNRTQSIDVKIFPVSKIIESVRSTGNEKSFEDDRDEMYYVQETKKLTDDWSFMYECEIDGELQIPENLLLPFGGEKKIFRVDIEKIDKLTEVEDIEIKKKLITKDIRQLFGIYCISDIIFDMTSVVSPDLAISKSKSFRYFSSDISKTSNYYRFSSSNQKENNYSGLVRSKKYNLIARGSVFYYFNEITRNEVAELITSNKQYQAIGFNQLIKILLVQ